MTAGGRPLGTWRNRILGSGEEAPDQLAANPRNWRTHPAAQRKALRGALSRTPTARQVDVLAAFVASGGSVSEAAARVGIRPSTAKRHLADLRARSGLTTEQLIY